MKITSRQLWDRLWHYLQPDKRYMTIAFVCALGVSGLSLLLGLVVKRLIDAMLHHNHWQLNMFCLGVVGVYAVRWFFVYGQTVYFAEAGQRLGLRLRYAIYEHLQSLSLGYFNRQRTGGLMSTINNDVPLLQNTVAGLKDVATAPFTVIGGLIIIFKISVPLSLAAILAVPIMGFSIDRLTRRIRQITRDTQDKLGDVNTLMEETLSGVRVIQSFGAEKYEIDRFRKENLAAKELYMLGTRKAAQLKPTIDVIGAAGMAFALWVGGQQIVDDRLTLGSLTFFIMTLNQIAVSISSLGSAKVTWEQVQGASSRILENVLDVESEIRDAPNAVTLSSVEGRIEFRNIAFSYHEHTPVLKDVSFTMEPGEVVAVVGPSGAGKSTIADLIPRFYDPQSGHIMIGDHDLRSVTVASLRKQIGIVPQETILFGGTIRENIAYGNPSATMEMVEAAARAANMHDEILLMHDGYQTIVGERGKQLSGGQRQRIAIARALLKDPRILILDEATSSLDTKSEVLVQAALDKLMQGRTTLVIAHRLSTIQNANKILVLESGRIVESGTHHELLRIGGLYARLYTQYQREDRPVTAPAVAASGA